MIVHSAILVDGKIYTGFRHHNIINSTKQLGLPFGYLRQGRQGFVDDKGNFYTREAALIHAKICGQLTKSSIHKTQLFSEDLW